mgnify:CR=1 FL=1
MTAALHRHIPRAALILALILTLIALTPGTAHADWLEDIGSWLEDANPLNGIVNIILSALRGFASWLFGIQSELAASLAGGTVLAGWEDLFGGGDDAVYRFAMQVNSALIQTVGYTLLSICMLIQLAKMGSRASSSDTMPLVQDLAMLMVYLFIMKFLIDNAAGICQLIYDASYFVMRVMADIGGTGWQSQSFTVPDDVTDMGALLGYILLGILGLLPVLLAYVVTYVVVWGRALQIYAFLAFSPIPIALLGSDETRPWALGFVKNFAAICLAGAVIMFVLMLFPLVYSIVCLPGGTGNIVLDAGGADSIAVLMRSVAIYILLTFALVKSGSWARDLMGG